VGVSGTIENMTERDDSERPTYAPAVPTSQTRLWLVVLALVAFIAVYAWGTSTNGQSSLPRSTDADYRPTDNNLSVDAAGTPVAGDVDCDELPGSNYAASNGDPYGLDRDGDGIGCESPSSGGGARSYTPSYSAPSGSSGGSTSNWCGKRDGDGDGLYCE
jgi:hypothetical protein